MNLWQKRLLRFWLVVGIPAVIYCGYQAYQSNIFIHTFTELASYWGERITADENGGPKSMFDARASFNEMSAFARESKSRRDFYIGLTAAILVLPAIFGIGTVVGKWVWGKTPSNVNESVNEIQSDETKFQPINLIKKYWQPALGVVAFGLIVMVNYLHDPNGAMRGLISSVVQAFFALGMVWVIRKMRGR